MLSRASVPARIRSFAAVAAMLAIVTSGAVIATQSAAAAPDQAVRINEVVSSGGSPGDWIELINTGIESVDISGYILKDNDDSHAKVIPANTVLEAGGYYTVDTDVAPNNFGLGAADSARLFAADGATLLDSYTWTSHGVPSYGHCPNGTGEFTTTLAVTKNAANSCAPVVRAADVLVINEVESSNGMPGDWIELHNRGTVAVDAAGLVLRDDNDANGYVIPTNSTVAPGGYIVVDESAFVFGLGGNDMVRLFDTDATTLIDSAHWTAHAAVTWGRCPDGTGAFANTASSTPGAANDCGTVTPPATPLVTINEVESSGGTPGDWVELYNRGTSVVDVSGWKILDNDDGHTPSVIPANSTIAPGGFLIVEEAALGFGLGGADSVRLFSSDDTLIDSTGWTAHAAVTWARCPDGTGAFAQSTVSTKGAPNDCSPPIRINEVESSSPTELDWIELTNIGTAPVDISGYILKDDKDSRTLAVPTGTTLAPGAFFAMDVDVTGGFGLGAADTARVYTSAGLLLDSYSWTAHATTTYGRCPDGTGAFTTTTAPTKGAANLCPGIVAVETWPGGTTVTPVPTDVNFGGDLSGLDYETSALGGDTMWTVINDTGVLSKLVQSGTAWNGAPGWGAGKTLRYPDGTGRPDAEGVTVADNGALGGVYVATERNNDANSISRPSILRYDVSGTGSTLVATHEWNLAADLQRDVPVIGANSGLEGITWVPDSVLVTRGFVDEATSLAYRPTDYPRHGSGVFFVALEANNTVYAYVLDLEGSTAQRIATIQTPGAMEVDFEAETQLLWAICDDACEGRTATYQIGESGHYELAHRYARPADSANVANEGFVAAPQATCVDGLKPVYYGDDADTGGVSLRVGTIRCTPLTDPGEGGPGTGEPGTGGPGTTPHTPAESELTPAKQNLITGPASASAGSTITLQIGANRSGQSVDAWIFSTPTSLGSHTVSSTGSITVTLPRSLAPGAHRIAVLAADGSTIGWLAITISAGSLSSTGADASGSLALAGLLLAAGIGLFGARAVSRRRIRA